MKASEVVFHQPAQTWVSCDRKGYATRKIKQLIIRSYICLQVDGPITGGGGGG